MTFCDNSDFAPLVPLREGKGSQMTEMEEVARGEDFLQAGVGVDPHLIGSARSTFLALTARLVGIGICAGRVRIS